MLVLFGLVGQIAWSVKNMYFNLFVFETVAPSLSTVTLMVQLSGIVATRKIQKLELSLLERS